MTTYSVTLSVHTDRQLSDEEACGLAACWADDCGFALCMTSTSHAESWLRVAALVTAGPTTDLAATVQTAVGNLAVELGEVGAHVTAWETVEVLSAAEQQRRGEHRAIPPMVNCAELAELAGVTEQRIYQYESDRKAGRRDDFPAPELDGYWLRTVGEHWAAMWKPSPGPVGAMRETAIRD